MLKIEKVSFLSEQGKRTNNEDSYGFIEDNVYVVCDGVGGNEKGEIASRIVTDTFLEFSKSQRDFPLPEALLFAEGNLSQYLEENPEAKGMATTLTVMQVLPKGINVGWVGDSRIYQFRNGEILFQTEDHSWVNEAVKAGIITEEEAINHPKSNVITRAVQGQFKPTVIETDSLTDIKKGDIFLLCSDGILESWSNEDFRALFKGESDLDKITLALDNKCKEFSRDNYTAIVVKIGDTDIVPVPRTYHTTYVEPKRSV
jgi:PPM family protein phosphatase